MLGRTADLRAVRASPGRAAVTGHGLGGACTNGEHGDPGGAADQHPAQCVSAIDGPRDALSERADPLVQAGPAWSAAHVTPPARPAAAKFLPPGAGSRQDCAKARTSPARTTGPAARTTPSPSTATSSGVADARAGATPPRRAA